MMVDAAVTDEMASKIQLLASYLSEKPFFYQPSVVMVRLNERVCFVEKWVA